MKEPFTFGIPLIGRVAATDWSLVGWLLELTLRSVLAQTDDDFQVLLAAHELPPAWGRLVSGDRRFVHLPAEWSPEPPTAANDDGGAKKFMIKQRIRETRGGLLMFLDADDWVDRELVRTARREIAPDDVGALIVDGIAVDYESLRAAAFPVPGFSDFRFHQLCGSSTIGRIDPSSRELIRVDPHAALGSHHEWEERAAAAEHRLARLDLLGAYLVGTGQNHSERQGPFSEWRANFSTAVRRTGEPLSAGTLARFGLSPDLF